MIKMAHAIRGRYKYEEPCLPHLVDLLNAKNNFARVAGRNAHPREENHQGVAHKDLEFAALVRNLMLVFMVEKFQHKF